MPTLRALLFLALLPLAGCAAGSQRDIAPEFASPGCRIDEIALAPVTMETGNLKACGPGDHADACNRAVTALDAACRAQCILFKKRSAHSPANPNVTAGICQPDPVRTSIRQFDPRKDCVDDDDQDQDRFKAVCTVSATCTCDP